MRWGDQERSQLSLTSQGILDPPFGTCFRKLEGWGYYFVPVNPDSWPEPYFNILIYGASIYGIIQYW